MDAAPRRFYLGLLAPVALAAGCGTTGLIPDQVKTAMRAQAPDGPAAPVVPLDTPTDTPTWTPSQPAPAPASQPAVSHVVPAGGPNPDDATTQIRPVAMIGSSVVITDDEVWQMVRQRAVEYIRLTGSERDTREKELFREELRKLIERELIVADFFAKIEKNKPQLIEVLKEDASKQAERQIRDIKQQNNFKTEEEFAAVLKSQGISLQTLERQLQRNAIMNMYLSQFLKDKRTPASLAEVRRFYDEHPDLFKLEDRVKWLDLFVSYQRFNTPAEAQKYAENLLQQLRGGADFQEIVKKHGHGDSALRGGEGVGEKRGEVRPHELEATLFAMQAGQLSELIPTQTGFHIIKVLERDVAGVRPFDEKSQTAIRNKLGAEAQKVVYDKLIEDLWRKTNVEVIGVP